MENLLHWRIYSTGESTPLENLLPQNVGSFTNYLQQSTEVAQWGTPSCSRPQPATDNGVRDGRSNCLVAPPEHLVHSINRHTINIERNAWITTGRLPSIHWYPWKIIFIFAMYSSHCNLNALIVFNIYKFSLIVFNIYKFALIVFNIYLFSLIVFNL